MNFITCKYAKMNRPIRLRIVKNEWQNIPRPHFLQRPHRLNPEFDK